MKGDNLSKFLNIFIALVAIIGAILFIRVFMADDDAIETDPVIQNSIISPLVSFSQILLYLAVGVTLVLSIWSLIKNPENLKKVLLSLGILGVILLVSYFSADSNAVTDGQGLVIKGGEKGASSNQWAGTGIWFSITLGVVGAAFFVVDLVKGLIKS